MPSNVRGESGYEPECVRAGALSTDIFAGGEFIEGNDLRQLLRWREERAARSGDERFSTLNCEAHTMRVKVLITTSLLAVLFVAAGCTQTNKKSDADAVKQALEQADLKDVSVSDDTDMNTVTLGGTLHPDDAKNRAGEIAKQAAPDRTVANEISVPVGDESQAKGVASNLDDGIENNHKAALISKRLDKQSIHSKAKNEVLTLTGGVKAPQQKSEAELLASKVPNVEQVIDQIQVKR